MNAIERLEKEIEDLQKLANIQFQQNAPEYEITLNELKEKQNCYNESLKNKDYA